LSWKNYKASELCSDIIDCVNKTAPISKSPTPYRMLRTSDIRDGFINLENLNSVSKETYLKWTRRGLLQKGDIVFTREAPLGEVGLVRHADNYFLGQRLVLYRANPKVCDNLFLLYWFLNPQNKESIKSRGVGATVTHLRVPECEKIEIKAPDIETQHRIGQILSAYDDLIENNQKQIKLLEEAAQRLYKQWFIDLRFPGHETIPIVDGVPEGWRKERVDDIYSIKYGLNLSTKQITLNGKYPVYGANGVIGYYDKANCEDQVVLITSRGNGSGDVLMTYHKKSFVTNNSFIVKPFENHNYCQLPFTYQFLRQANFKSVRTGAAQPQLTNQSIHMVEVILPSEDLIISYCQRTLEFYEAIMNLKDRIHILNQARDRLLPKLMNGKIEV